MDDGDEPEIAAMVTDSWYENPEFYWNGEPTMACSNGVEIAMGLAIWRFDGHVDAP